MKPGFLVLDERDNVGVALRSLSAGTRLDHGVAQMLILQDDIPMGHKFALVDVALGEPVLKYGAVMGVATAQVARGGHVHTHNVESRRGRGDLV